MSVDTDSLRRLMHRKLLVAAVRTLFPELDEQLTAADGIGDGGAPEALNGGFPSPESSGSPSGSAHGDSLMNGDRRLKRVSGEYGGCRR